MLSVLTYELYSFHLSSLVCRTADLYLTSSIGSGLKQRPQLNLTVRKELKGLGGKIIAQSGMAKVCTILISEM